MLLAPDSPALVAPVAGASAQYDGDWRDVDCTDADTCANVTVAPPPWRAHTSLSTSGSILVALGNIGDFGHSQGPEWSN